MNTLNASVTSCQSVDNVTIVTFESHGTTLRMMSLEQNLPLAKGTAVVLGFKASNVSLAKTPLGEITISNRLHGSIERVSKGELLCILTLRFHETLIESIITRASFDAFGLQAGDNVVALVKASELSIVAVHDD